MVCFMSREWVVLGVEVWVCTLSLVSCGGMDEWWHGDWSGECVRASVSYSIQVYINVISPLKW